MILSANSLIGTDWQHRARRSRENPGIGPGFGCDPTPSSSLVMRVVAMQFEPDVRIRVAACIVAGLVIDGVRIVRRYDLFGAYVACVTRIRAQRHRGEGLVAGRGWSTRHLRGLRRAASSVPVMCTTASTKRKPRHQAGVFRCT